MAHESAVEPSGVAALTSTEGSSASKALTSRRFTASSSRRSVEDDAAHAAERAATRSNKVRRIQSLDCQVLQFTRAIAELVSFHTGLLEHRQQQVVHRRFVGILDVTAALDLAGPSPNQRQRQIGVSVAIAVRDAAAV